MVFRSMKYNPFMRYLEFGNRVFRFIQIHIEVWSARTSFHKLKPQMLIFQKSIQLDQLHFHCFSRVHHTFPWNEAWEPACENSEYITCAPETIPTWPIVEKCVINPLHHCLEGLLADVRSKVVFVIFIIIVRSYASDPRSGIRHDFVDQSLSRWVLVDGARWLSSRARPTGIVPYLYLRQAVSIFNGR